MHAEKYLSLNALHMFPILRNNPANTVYHNECDQHSQHSHILVISLLHSQIADVRNACTVIAIRIVVWACEYTYIYECGSAHSRVCLTTVSVDPTKVWK